MSIWINSVKGVTKYRINNRIVLILGELHDQSIVCSRKGAGISVFDYLKERAADNDRAIFLLEFNTSNTTDYSRIGSKIIRDVFTGGVNNVRDKTRGVDTRLDCITQTNQNILYNDDTQLYNIYVNPVLRRRSTTPSMISMFIATYIDPYYKKGQLECGDDEKLLDYKKDLTATFDDVKARLGKSGNLFATDDKFRDEIMTTIRWGWARLMDFEILREIRSVDSSNEIIIVVGNNHRKNIRDTMRGWIDSIELLNIDERTEKDCLSREKLQIVDLS